MRSSSPIRTSAAPPTMRILISGLGIAGPTLAYWLVRHGFEPVIVEQAPRLRSGGYIVDFWGKGYDVAERMSLLPEIHARGYFVQEVRLVDRSGRRVGGFPADVFRRTTGDRFVSLPRGQLSAAIYDAIEGKVEVLFGDSVAALDERSDGVAVRFACAPARAFDLVIGADGLHSQIRRLRFGDEQDVELHLAYKVAAFEAAGYAPRDENVYVGYSEPGRQVARFAMRDDRTLFLFVFHDASPDLPPHDDLEAQKRVLHGQFGSAGWECPRILAALDACDEIYLDRVSQIRMERWTQGRVALVGDAAYCPSLLAGEGSALAMIGAYVLAGELARARGDWAVAFARYEERLRPFLVAKQRAAVRFAPSFAPRTALGIALRNLVTRAFAVPPIADFFLGRTLRDELELPSE